MKLPESPWPGCQSIAGLPPSIKFAGTHLDTWVEIYRGTVKVKTKAHNTVTRPGLERGSVDSETSALTKKGAFILILLSSFH